MKGPLIIPREVFKKDPVFKKLWELVKSRHQVAQHTRKTLWKNKDIKNFCESSRTYVSMADTVFIHYDVDTWIKRKANGFELQTKVTEIGIYDDQMQYETARLKGLHSTTDSDIPNIN